MKKIRKWKSLLFSDVSLNYHFLLFVLYILFFLSGCAALIYQIMWQRMLFVQLGVDTTSITVIISVFMFGLGIGGIIGGVFADKMPNNLLRLYFVIELCIALFGFVSPYLIGILANINNQGNEITTGLESFIILGFPTILMGATFPILVTHINHYYQNIGKSVGKLYFVNTIGAAAGAFLSGFILLYVTDLIGAIDRAALLNIIIACVALAFFRRKANVSA